MKMHIQKILCQRWSSSHAMRFYLLLVCYFLYYRTYKCQDIVVYNAANDRTIYDTDNGFSFTSYFQYKNRYLTGTTPFKIFQGSTKVCQLSCLQHRCVSYNVGQDKCELFNSTSGNLLENNDFDHWTIEVRRWSTTLDFYSAFY